jgi:hypothetical protein
MDLFQHCDVHIGTMNFHVHNVAAPAAPAKEAAASLSPEGLATPPHKWRRIHRRPVIDSDSSPE